MLFSRQACSKGVTTISSVTISCAPSVCATQPIARRAEVFFPTPRYYTLMAAATMAIHQHDDTEPNA